MSSEIAAQSVDFIYNNTTPKGERIQIGFFGGEPLLHFDMIETIARLVHEHHAYTGYDVEMMLVTNATLLTGEIFRRLTDLGIGIGASCDGPPVIQDLFRRFSDGSSTSLLVENNLKMLAASVPNVMVNAVYRPETVQYLPQSIEYFSALGIRRIILSADFSALWTARDIAGLAQVYDAVGKKYCDYYRQHDPHYISLIDSKIPVIMRGGYHDDERCRMGNGEFTISPQGNLFPCERLVGDGSVDNHCIGTLQTGPILERMQCHRVPGGEVDGRCAACDLQKYCMHWCGCSNFFATSYYNRVSEILCASERAALNAAMNIMEELGGMMALSTCADK